MKKQKLSAEEKAAVAKKQSFQDRLPIEDIKSRLFVTKDGRYLPAYQLGQKAIELMTDDDVVSYANQIEVAFETMGVEKIQFLLLPIPFDMEPYKRARVERIQTLKNELSNLEAKMISVKKEMDNYFNKVGLDPTTNKLNEYEVELSSLEAQIEQNKKCQLYINNQNTFVTRFMQSGAVAIKRCFLIFEIRDSWNETAVQEAAASIEKGLLQIAPNSYRCSEAEMQKILIELFNPLRPEVYINE